MNVSSGSSTRSLIEEIENEDVPHENEEKEICTEQASGSQSWLMI